MSRGIFFRGLSEMYKSKNKNREKGVALLVVLFIVMVATILSVGFLTRSDTELACGENMLLRTQMDYLAESGLEHAKGRITAKDPNAAGQWTGQLTAGSSDYYDVVVSPRVPPFDPNDPNKPCTYQIISTAYREKNSQRVGESVLKGQLYVDPATGTSFRSIKRN
jgi:hypothetical protein